MHRLTLGPTFFQRGVNPKNRFGPFARIKERLCECSAGSVQKLAFSLSVTIRSMTLESISLPPKRAKSSFITASTKTAMLDWGVSRGTTVVVTTSSSLAEPQERRPRCGSTQTSAVGP